MLDTFWNAMTTTPYYSIYKMIYILSHVDNDDNNKNDDDEFIPSRRTIIII